jgi:hypothetical protein
LIVDASHNIDLSSGPLSPRQELDAEELVDKT